MRSRFVLAALAMVSLLNLDSNAQHGAMPFDQDKSTHHFVLARNGGLIQVDANDPADNATRDRIRSHLTAIADDFAKGVFEKPFRTHGETPPGVPTLQRLKEVLTYTFEKTSAGGQVRITTSNPEALEAVHSFLRYQITEHHTEDPRTLAR
jgi:hypothetical protein